MDIISLKTIAVSVIYLVTGIEFNYVLGYG